jgi:hypothetical protein
MTTLRKTLVVHAALAALLSSAVAARAGHHEAKGKDKAKEKAGKEGKAGKSAEKRADEKVNCLGVNACKGKSECGVEGKHGCAGHNACKGQGWITLTKKACDAKKGTVMGAPVMGEPAQPQAKGKK